MSAYYNELDREKAAWIRELIKAQVVPEGDVDERSIPLAHGASNRVLKLRGYGDAIVAPLAQAFIESYLEVSGMGS